MSLKSVYESDVASPRPLSSSPLIISEEGDASLNRYDGNMNSTKFNSNPVVSFAPERSFINHYPMGWDETFNAKSKGIVRFKAYFAGGTKRDNLIVDTLGNQLIIIGPQLQEKEVGGACSLVKNCKSFILPSAVNPKGFETSMDNAGVLTVTFKKIKPQKKKLVSKLKLFGCLAQALLLASFKSVFDEVVGDNY